MKKILIKILQHILNIFLPLTCHHCGCDLPAGTKEPLCANCISTLRAPGPLVCKRCGVTLPSGGATCVKCRGSKSKIYKCSVVRSAFVFTPALRSLVHNYKYYRHTYLRGFLAENLRLRFIKTKEFAQVDIICPVPLHPLKQRNRGYNQSALIARSLAEAQNIAFSDTLLKRTRRTAAQAKLDKEHRKENVKDAFACTQKLCGKTILIVDDVITTGSTLEACAAALKKAKAKNVYALTLAREE